MKQHITAPRGYELKRKVKDGVEYVTFEPIKEVTSLNKIENVIEILEKYNEEKDNQYYLDSCGTLGECDRISWNHSTKQEIEVERLFLILRRYCKVLNEKYGGVDWNNIEQEKINYFYDFKADKLNYDDPFSCKEALIYILPQAQRELEDTFGIENIEFIVKNI